jgi:sterol desaturase/sphingolipid hydroxylase (fatty acid hydroxylase superfamily)
MHSVWQTLVSVIPVLKAHFLAVLCFTVAEAFLGVERRPPWREQFANLQYVLIFFFVSPFATILPTALAADIARQTGPGLFKFDLPVWANSLGLMAWPVRNFLMPAVPLLIFDFFYYWHHRLQHRVRAFWAIHRLHHSIENLNALAGYRVHWLEIPMRVLTITIPMTFLFDITPVQGAWLAFVLDQLGIFIHSNVRVPLGPLTPVLAGPQLHRLHHSLKPEHHDKNYAAFFPIWDIVFGTYIAPERGEWPKTGLSRGRAIGSVLQEIVYPFAEWSRSLSGVFRTRPDSVPVIK